MSRLNEEQEITKKEASKTREKRTKSNFVVRLVLVAVIVGLSITLISMLADIAVKNKENDAQSAATKEQIMKNAEMKEILDPTNAADFNRDIAEKELDYADGGEKVYVSPDSGK